MNRRVGAVAVAFLSAFLLFAAQPHWGRRLAPLVGSGPAVWNACLVFFQTALLVGYAWALFLSTRSPRIAGLLHAGALIGAACWLFAAPTPQFAELQAFPTLQSLLMLTVLIGPAIAALGATTPLVHHIVFRDAVSTRGYGVYAASNAGSFAALVLYPSAVEPLLGLDAQWAIWRLVFIAFSFGLIVLAWRAGGVSPMIGDSVEAPADGARALGIRPSSLFWSALPSALLVSTTQRITEDVAGGPLLWLPPLAIFLFASILAFAGWNFSVRWTAWLLPPLLLIRGAVTLTTGVSPVLWLQLVVELAVLFAATWSAFSILYELRPAARQAAAFYLQSAFGGALGGFLAALAAPHLFHSTAEHPLGLLLLVLFLPTSHRTKRRYLEISFAAAVVSLLVISRTSGGESAALETLLLVGSFGMMLAAAVGRRPAFGLLLGVPFAFLMSTESSAILYVERSEFGVHRVVRVHDERDGELHVLRHGGVLHGWQHREPGRAREPLGYHHPQSAVGEALDWRIRNSGRGRIAVVGLGVGAVIGYRQPGQHFDFFEIDPVVAKIAADPRCFTFLAEAAGVFDVHLGDGRLLLSRMPDASYSTIFLDAFSGDAVPMHLLTKEAFATYARKLAPGGVVIANISNWYVELEATAVNSAASAGFAAIRKNQPGGGVGPKPTSAPTRCVLLSMDGNRLTSLASRLEWRRLSPSDDAPLWTDDYCSLWPVLRWRGENPED